MDLNEGTETQFCCENCLKTFPDFENLKKHKQSSCKEAYQCMICNKNFPRKHLFDKHLKRHESNEIITCRTCSQEFPDQKSKRNHLKTEHGVQEKKCKFCPALFGTKNEYLEHIESVHKGTGNNYFMCSDCGKQYKTKNELTHHINSKCGTLKQFKCQICEQELMSAGSLYNHVLRHNGEKSYMCPFCAKLFFTAGQLKVHERTHTQDKAYVCEVCNKGFCHRQSLITHSTLHTGIKPYQCENCGNSFSCVGNLIKHRKSHADTCGLIPLTTHRVNHPSTKIKVKINTPANSKLKTKEKIKELEKELNTLKSELDEQQPPQELPSEAHTETSSNDIVGLDVTQNECESDAEYDDNSHNFDPLHENNGNHETKQEVVWIKSENKEPKKKKCIKRTKPEEEFQDLIRETAFIENGYANCKYCGKRYMNMAWLHKHIKEHEMNISNEADEKIIPLHKCSCCKMSFYTKDDCLVHQQSAHAELLTCNDCEKIFANRDSLRSHQKVFHKGFGRKIYLYICKKCGKQFKQKSNLIFHESRDCNKGPFYECPTCKKEFSSKHTRNNHMRIHDPEKKLLCKFCAKSFHWKGQLKIHERSHTGEKPFTCLYCPKAFTYRESLITHSTIHTGIKPHLCEGCGSRFSCIGNLIKHRNAHANECGAWMYKTQRNEEIESH